MARAYHEPGNELERRLRDVLDSAQYLYKVFPGIADSDGRIDLTSMALYSPKTKDVILKDLWRSSMQEAGAFMLADSLGKPRIQSIPPDQKAFYKLRRTILFFGDVWKDNVFSALIEDSEETSSMCLRVSQTHYRVWRDCELDPQCT